MTAAERFWLRVHRRMTGLQPDMAAALLRSFALVRESLSPTQLAAFIARGDVDGVLRLAFGAPIFDRAFLPFREQLRRTTERGFRSTLADLPKAGKIDGALAVTFNYLSPDVVTAIRALDTRVLTALKDDVRETVRAFSENGLRDGRAPRAVAREIRDLIGLGKTQLQEVQNFRDALLGKEGRSIQEYTLRNRTVDRLLKKGPLTAEQVDRYTEAYRKARLTQNAATISRTATLDSYRLGQHLSWKAAQENGVIPEGYQLMKEWMQLDRPTKRDEHIPLNGEVVPFDQPYSNGSMVPGDDGSYNCGCLSRVFVARADQVAALTNGTL